MSDVRIRLERAIAQDWGVPFDNEQVISLADAILERFEVTPKPVVTNRGLGTLVQISCKDETFTTDHIGERMLEQLRASGLKIVRVDDES
jgi:hypothetical protein